MDKSSRIQTEEDSPFLPRFETLDALVDFFDTHDMGAYADQMPEADFDLFEREPQKTISYNSGVSD